jgi:methylmalonyl-CoA/ethylmalonyl-CoA epimerase
MDSGAGVGIRRIGQIAVTVRDVERATEFYRDVLGLRHLFDAPPGLSFFDCGGVRLMLGVPERGEFDHPTSILYLDVPAIEASHAVLLERGVHFESDPAQIADLGDRTLWLAPFRDSEGNMLALMSEVQNGPTGSARSASPGG